MLLRMGCPPGSEEGWRRTKAARREGESVSVSMSDTDRSPFRRFPWAQLAFCVACLAMTTYTWMRYSYAWELTPEGLGSFTPEYAGLFDIWKPAFRNPTAWPSGSYVRLTESGQGGCLAAEPLYAKASVFSEEPLYPLSHLKMWSGLRAPGDESCIRYFYGRLKPHQPRPVYGSSHPDLILQGTPIVDTAASRFHPASVAGLVVGAMGCFIFGLYLRRWLRERLSPQRHREHRGRRGNE